jgi:hypothetical protein
MTTYKSYTTTFGKSDWRVIVSNGNRNQVSVAKVTTLRRPFYKDFASFEKAIENYKDKNVKLYLELISLGFIIEKSTLVSE